MKELAMVNLTYGNEASLEWCYSHAAILVTVPARGEREKEAKKMIEPSVKPSLIDVATF